MLFKPPKSAYFLASFPWSPLSKISENGRFRCICQICHNSALQALLEPPIAPKGFPIIGLSVPTNEDIVLFAPNCFSSRQSRPTFWPVSLGPPLAKSQKMGDLGVFAKFVITRLCRHFWSRRLRRKVFRLLDFQCLLMKISCYLRRIAFQAAKVGLLFGQFPLVPP